jgi:Spy/CpxP family protein refolding chaperone
MLQTLTSRPRLVLTILLLSLALNVCVIGGVFYARATSHGWPPPLPGRRLDQLAERLKLTPEQMPAFDEYHRTLRREQQVLAEQDRPALREAWDELRRDHPDSDKVKAALDLMAAHRRKFQEETAAATIRFMAVLTPEQRTLVEHSVTERHGPADSLMRNVGN